MAVEGKRRMPGTERRATILRAGGLVFARDGYGGARVEDIAAAAGVTKPIVYRHFGSKKGLYMALLEKHRDDLPRFFEIPGGPGAILEVWLDYVRANGHAWVMLFRDASGDDEMRAFRVEVSRRAREVMAGFIADASPGRVPAAEIEPTAEMLVSGLAGLALWWIDHPGVAKPDVLEAARRVVAPLLEP